MTLVRRIARPLLASMFVVGGLDMIRHPGTKTEAAKPLLDKVAPTIGIPNDPELVVRATGAAMVSGGAMLALGRMPRLAATMLAATLVPTTVVSHPFWAETDPERKRQQQSQFLKNLGLLGGVLLAAVDTEGKPGLAYRAKMVGDSATRAAKTTRREAKLVARATKREAKLKGVQAKNALS